MPPSTSTAMTPMATKSVPSLALSHRVNVHGVCPRSPQHSVFYHRGGAEESSQKRYIIEDHSALFCRVLTPMPIRKPCRSAKHGEPVGQGRRQAYDTAFQRLRDGMDDLAEVLSPVLVKQLEDLKFAPMLPLWGGEWDVPSQPRRNPQQAGVGSWMSQVPKQLKVRQRVIELTQPEHSISTARLMKRHSDNLRKCIGVVTKRRCSRKTSKIRAGKHGCWRWTEDLTTSFTPFCCMASLFRITPDRIFAEVAEAVEMVQKAAAHPASPDENLVHAYTTSGLPLAFAEAMAIDEDN